MNSLQAFAINEASQGNRARVFDWNKAAELIRDNKPKLARAGLESDWEWTGGDIWEDGKPSDDYTFLASNWATPELEMDGEICECWKYCDECGWNSETKWPESALKILGIKKK